MKLLFAKLLGVTNSVWRFYAPILKTTAYQGLPQLLPVALDVVQSLAKTGKTGSEKRNEAIAVLLDWAKLQGLSVSESLVRWTIESAVQRIKA